MGSQSAISKLPRSLHLEFRELAQSLEHLKEVNQADPQAVDYAEDSVRCAARTLITRFHDRVLLNEEAAQPALDIIRDATREALKTLSPKRPYWHEVAGQLQLLDEGTYLPVHAPV